MRKFAGPAILFGLLALAIMWPKLKQVVFGQAKHGPPAATFQWEDDFAIAKQHAQEQSKPMLVVFSASWCPPCQQMRREVWPDAAVGEVVSGGYVPIYLDVDESSNQELTEKYGVNAIPFVIIINAQGSVIDRAHTMSRDETLAFLKKPRET